jgi:hypothetical protein
MNRLRPAHPTAPGRALEKAYPLMISAIFSSVSEFAPFF